jgi:hypothetical protein
MARRMRPLQSSVAVLALLFVQTLVLLAACAQPEPVVTRAPPAGLPSDVERLRGFTAAELARRLGEPDFVRREPPAVIWQYRSEDCVLELFLYEGGDALLVAYAETHDRELARAAQSDCYAEIVARRARPL